MLIKTCPTCEIVFDSAVYFSRDRTRQDGLSGVCKPCEHARNSFYYYTKKKKK